MTHRRFAGLLLTAMVTILAVALPVPGGTADQPALSRPDFGPAANRPQVFRELPDGRLFVDGRLFPGVSAYFTSAYFRDRGLRCATPEIDANAADGGDPSDCSLSFTNPDAVYDPSVREYRIPVVFHILHRVNNVGNITDQRVIEQVEVLNEDFLALPGSNGEPGTDCQISFFLATEDPGGQPTDGIMRYANDSWHNDQGGYYNTIAWDTSRYMNVYVNSGGGALGYVPGLPQQGGLVGSPADRVVVYYRTVGRNTGYVPYHLGRTLTHEVGHYLGGYHTFYGGCAPGNAPACYSTGDRICDTGSEESPTFGCPGNRVTCGSLDPFHNYLDYADDICMDNWTPEQARRMRCTLEHYRPDLAVTDERVSPDSFQVTFGRYVAGDVGSLRFSDDDNVEIEQRPGFTPLLPLIQVETAGAAATFAPAGLRYTLEAAASAVPPNVPQRIELRDQALAEWEAIDERLASATQVVVEVEVTGDPSRFIAAGSGALAARLSWFDPGNVLFPAWGVTIDQAVWTLESGG